MVTVYGGDGVIVVRKEYVFYSIRVNIGISTHILLSVHIHIYLHNLCTKKKSKESYASCRVFDYFIFFFFLLSFLFVSVKEDICASLCIEEATT